MKLARFIGCLSLGITSLQAEYFKPIVQNDKVKLEFRTEMAFAYSKVYNSFYGVGSAEVQNPNIILNNPYWDEGYIKPQLLAKIYLKNGSEFYSKFSAIWAATWGQGDAFSPISTTSNHPNLLFTEDAYVGWRSGRLFKRFDENLIDFSIGNQPVLIADGFLIAKGSYSGFRRATFILAPSSIFQETALLKLNAYPFRAQIFHLRTNTNQRYLQGGDQPKTLLYGANIEYFSRDLRDKTKEFWRVGMNFFYIYRADKNFDTVGLQARRDGLQVYNPHLGGFFLPWNRDIRFYAGYVFQRNNKFNSKVRASAYYIEPGYVFSKLWGTPLLFYRYMYYSGGPSAGPIKRSYDNLVFGYWIRDGYGTWEIGEIGGQFYYSNSNKKVHNFQLKLTPTKEYTLGVLYFIVNFDKISNVSKRAATELDIYITWTPSSWFSLSTILGANIPKAGIKQLLGIGKTVYLAYMSATFKL